MKNLKVTWGSIPKEGHVGQCSCLRDFCSGLSRHVCSKAHVQTPLCSLLLSTCLGCSISLSSSWSDATPCAAAAGGSSILQGSSQAKPPWKSCCQQGGRGVGERERTEASCSEGNGWAKPQLLWLKPAASERRVLKKGCTACFQHRVSAGRVMALGWGRFSPAHGHSIATCSEPHFWSMAKSNVNHFKQLHCIL